MAKSLPKKKAAKKKTTSKKKPVKKPATKKSAPKKSVPKKSVNRKPATKKAVKKATPKKKVVKKTPLKKKSVANPKVKRTVAKKSVRKVSSKKKSSSRVSSKPKRKIKTRYSAKELAHFKAVILKERTQIIESARANMRSLVDDESGDYVGDNQTYASHMAEQGSDEMEREKNYMFVQRDEKYLGYLNEALSRIDLGTYGVCIDCFDVPKNLCKTCPLIQKERLELVPITQHCIECKNMRG